MNESDLKTVIIENLEFYVKKTIAVNDKHHLINDLDLDSFDINNLANDLEEAFEITIPDHEIIRQHFETVAKLVAFVGSKISQ